MEITKTEPTYEKISDTQLKITFSETRTETTEKVETLDYDFLSKQEAQINEQRDTIKATLEDQLADNETKRAAEIADVKARLAICEAQGLKTKAELEAQAGEVVGKVAWALEAVREAEGGETSRRIIITE